MREGGREEQWRKVGKRDSHFHPLTAQTRTAFHVSMRAPFCFMLPTRDASKLSGRHLQSNSILKTHIIYMTLSFIQTIIKRQ